MTDIIEINDTPEDIAENEVASEDRAPTDEETLQEFINFVEERGITINTGFIADEDSGNFTHQVIQISCGELSTVSNPEMLVVPVRPLLAEELSDQKGVTLN